MHERADDITRILRSWDIDRGTAMETLMPIVYAELRRTAAAYLRQQRPGHTLQPTALVHETYLRMVRQDIANLKDRGHFFTLAAKMMRQILVDAARVRLSAKRGAGQNVSLEVFHDPAVPSETENILTVHEALEGLKEKSERTAQVMELKYFGGLQLEEIAAALDVSLATVKRDHGIGIAWLKRALGGNVPS